MRPDISRWHGEDRWVWFPSSPAHTAPHSRHDHDQSARWSALIEKCMDQSLIWPWRDRHVLLPFSYTRLLFIINLREASWWWTRNREEEEEEMRARGKLQSIDGWWSAPIALIGRSANRSSNGKKKERARQAHSKSSSTLDLAQSLLHNQPVTLCFGELVFPSLSFVRFFFSSCFLIIGIVEIRWRGDRGWCKVLQGRTQQEITKRIFVIDINKCRLPLSSFIEWGTAYVSCNHFLLLLRCCCFFFSSPFNIWQLMISFSRDVHY